MDWSKAKSILIVSFLIINLLLGYVLFWDSKEIDTTLTTEFIGDVVSLLNNKEIHLHTEIPKDNPSLISLIVEYEMMKPRELNRNYFNNKGSTEYIGQDLVEIRYIDDVIKIINRKLVIFESKNKDKRYNIDSEDQAIEFASEFLIEKGYDLSDMKLSFIKEIEGEFYLEYSKVYNDIFLESAFTNIQINKYGVKRLERKWLEVIDEGEKPIYIDTAPKSILSLLSMEEVYEKTIRNISLSYYFEPEKHDYIEDPEQANQGRTIPAWRIQFDDGYKVFLDNY